MKAVIDFWRRNSDRLLGRGEAAVTLPPMDGALLPNNVLEQARKVAELPQIDNLVMHEGRLLCSAGHRLWAWQADTGLQPQVEFDAAVAALVSLSDGPLLAALVDGSLHRVTGAGAERLQGLAGFDGFCPTAMVAVDSHTLVLTEGSSHHLAHEWKRDLMSRERSGRVWRLDLAAGRAQLLASGLGWAGGAALTADGQVVVSESWSHRLCTIPLDGAARRAPQPVLSELPAYPGRLVPAAGGGYWLPLFAPRSQLVEFVLREAGYRARMMAEIAEPFWVAPALESGSDFREPLQGGAIKSMGVLKPWAPTRSYGLVVRLDAQFNPLFSLHSRADGRRHGVTSVLEHQQQLWVASQGGRCLLSLTAGDGGEWA